ncbi:MAG: hypothetical protein AVDCRST_MAG56-4243, partial [uncultured Cytophagales bacterium]
AGHDALRSFTGREAGWCCRRQYLLGGKAGAVEGWLVANRGNV